MYRDSNGRLRGLPDNGAEDSIPEAVVTQPKQAEKPKNPEGKSDVAELLAANGAGNAQPVVMDIDIQKLIDFLKTMGPLGEMIAAIAESIIPPAVEKPDPVAAEIAKFAAKLDSEITAHAKDGLTADNITEATMTALEEVSLAQGVDRDALKKEIHAAAEKQLNSEDFDQATFVKGISELARTAIAAADKGKTPEPTNEAVPDDVEFGKGVEVEIKDIFLEVAEVSVYELEGGEAAGGGTHLKESGTLGFDEFIAKLDVNGDGKVNVCRVDGCDNKPMMFRIYDEPGQAGFYVGDDVVDLKVASELGAEFVHEHQPKPEVSVAPGFEGLKQDQTRQEQGLMTPSMGMHA